jgi:hypothetical protein
MARACHGVLEMVGLFRDVTVLPVAASRSDKDAYLSEETRRFATEAAGRILCSGKSLVAILETQRQWRTQIGPIMAALEIEEEEKKEPSGFVKQVAADGWAPLCNVVVAPNGVTVMPLTDPRELKYEGFGYHNGPKTAAPDPDGNMGLNHCVGGYSETCRRGNHIVSFRLYDGADPAKFTRLSTCEFHPIKADTNQLQKKQHYGVNDSTPNQTSRDAYDWFVHEVEVGNIPINREGVMSYMSGRKRAEDDVQEQAGYDRKNLDLVAAGLRAWQPYLTKKFRGLSVEALRQTPEVDPVAEAISPSYMPTY